MQYWTLQTSRNEAISDIWLAVLRRLWNVRSVGQKMFLIFSHKEQSIMPRNLKNITAKSNTVYCQGHKGLLEEDFVNTVLSRWVYFPSCLMSLEQISKDLNSQSQPQVAHRNMNSTLYQCLNNNMTIFNALNMQQQMYLFSDISY